MARHYLRASAVIRNIAASRPCKISPSAMLSGQKLLESTPGEAAPKACRRCKGRMFSRWEKQIRWFHKRSAKTWHPALTSALVEWRQEHERRYCFNPKELVDRREID